MDTKTHLNLDQLLDSKPGQRPLQFFLKYSPHVEVVVFDRHWNYVDSNRAFQVAYREVERSQLDDFFELPTGDNPYPTPDTNYSILSIRDRATQEYYQAYFSKIDSYHLLILIKGIANPDKVGEVMNFMAMELANTMRDLRRKNAELVQAQRRIERLLEIDPLTGLYNRRFMDKHLPSHIGLAERKKIELCLAICDLDQFKKINDQHGHQIGDRVLVQFASILRLNTRIEDACIRYGGEEFVIVMPALELDHAQAFCERLRQLAESSGGLEHQHPEEMSVLPRWTVSIGIAEFREGMTDESLVQAADEALYLAKAQGRNQVVINRP